jgi:hypothetical protein
LPKEIPRNHPQPEPEVLPEKIQSQDFSLGSGTVDQTKESFSDLIEEARGLKQADPVAVEPDKIATDSGAGPAPVVVKPSFAETLTDLWTKSLRIGVKYATKGDLLPPTPEQRARFDACLSGLAQKHLPPAFLAMQDEMSLAGVSAEYVMSNMTPAPKEPDKEVTP